jgi:hypothetical protein
MDVKRSVWESMTGWRYALGHVQAKAGEVPAIVKREIGETVKGYGYGAKYVGGIAKREVEEIVTGLGYGASLVVGKAGESFGDIRSSFESIKWWLLIPILILVFVAVMVSIGYSGLGGPVARVAEREHARVR